MLEKNRTGAKRNSRMRREAPKESMAKLFKTVIIFKMYGYRIKKSINQNRQRENFRY